MEKQVYLLKKNVRKKENFRKKRVKEEGRSYFRSPQKYECHSHIAPFDKKEWQSSFAPNFRSGAHWANFNKKVHKPPYLTLEVSKVRRARLGAKMHLVSFHIFCKLEYFGL